MKPPIFLANRGDLLIFEALESAERYVEPIDVNNQEYVGFDSEGLCLRFENCGKDVRIVETEAKKYEPMTLAGLIATFIAVVEKNQRSNPKVLTLAELVAKASRYTMK